MRIYYGSDLHGEFNPMYPKLPDDGDVLILAGDITTVNKLADYRTDAASRAQKKFFNDLMKDACAKFEVVIMTSGNHEYYGSDFNEANTRLHEYANWHGFWYLYNDWMHHKDVSFYAGPMWTEAPSGALNDYNMIRRGEGAQFWRPEDATGEHKSFKARIEGEHRHDNLVVVSHHAPHIDGISPLHHSSMINDEYYTDMSEFMEENEVTAWVHGHTHIRKEYQVGNTKVYSNGRGYPGEIKDKFEWKSFEI